MKILNPVVAAFLLVLVFGSGVPQVSAQEPLLPRPEGGLEPDGPLLPAPDAPDLPELDGGDSIGVEPDLPEEPVAPLDQAALLDKLFGELADLDHENWQMTERNIWIQWSRSGSAAMDLLLERGKQAMAAGDWQAAIEHLTALVDHAPDFAEGWNARATAYYQAGLFGPSIDDVRHVLALNPRHFGALSGLAMMLEELDYPEDALEAYEAARAIHPRAVGVLQGIERLHKKLDGLDI